MGEGDGWNEIGAGEKQEGEIKKKNKEGEPLWGTMTNYPRS